MEANTVSMKGRFRRHSTGALLILAILLPAALWAQPAIPDRALWESRMLSSGLGFCNQADIAAAIGAGGVVTESNVWYYDGTRVYEQIGAYSGDPSWYTCAEYVKQQYQSWVLTVTAGASFPVGALNGWRIFPHGQLLNYVRTGDPNDKQTLLRLAYNSAFAGSGGAAGCDTSRETAYLINASLAAEAVGEPRNPLLATSVNYALGHIDQWFISRTCANTVPFMVGLTMEALIGYYIKTGDVRIPPAIRVAVDGLWNTAWLPASSSFYFDSNDTTTPAPDLNLLIAPAFAWLWQTTGQSRYLQEGDQVFSGGVENSFFSTGKQFSQNYRWSFDYVKWRSTPAQSLAVSSTGFVFSRVTNSFNGKLTVTNTGSQTVSAPILVELTNLPAGVSMMNATGTTGGTPYVAVQSSGSLAPGQSASVNVQFSDPSHTLITFTPIAY